MTTLEVLQRPQEAAYERMDRIPKLQGSPYQNGKPDLPDYVEQWFALENLDCELDREPGMVPHLLDYAADPEKPLLMRSYALDAALSSSWRTVQGQNRYHAQPTPKQVEVCERMWQVAPEYFGGHEQLNDVRSGDMPMLGAGYFRFFSNLAESEGLRPQLIDPEPIFLDVPLDTVATKVPVAPTILLKRLIGGEGALDINYLSPEVSRAALDLALDFRSDAYREAIVDGKYAETAEFARLWRLTKAGGDEHKAPIDFLFQLPEGDRAEYARTFNRLYDAQEKLEVYFPGYETTNAAKALVVQALFAVEKHVRNGMVIDETIPLARKGEQSARFKGNKPIRLLNELSGWIEFGHEMLMKSKPEVFKDTPEFTIFNFPALDPDDRRLLDHYIRPNGSHNCDYRFEYGGNKPGVRGSIDYRFDKDIQDLTRPHHKSSRTDSAFSIRLDLDPPVIGDTSWDVAKDDGLVTLDIGSILGTGFGRDIALLLAVGNKLRSQAIGSKAAFNHQTEQLDQEMGKASVFSDYARARRERLMAAAGYSVPEPLRVAAAAALAGAAAANS